MQDKAEPTWRRMARERKERLESADPAVREAQRKADEAWARSI